MEQDEWSADGAHEWAIVVHMESEQEGEGFWAEVTELPGFLATHGGFDEMGADLSEAIASHVAKLQEAGLAVPPLLLVPGSSLPIWGN